jgi:hypothetical protein
MLPSSSSIFSSNLARTGHARLPRRALYRRRLAAVVLSTVAALIAFDAILGAAFRPATNSQQQLSGLRQYFNYGRSVDGKLRDMIADNPADDAAIVKAAWNDREYDVDSFNASCAATRHGASSPQFKSSECSPQAYRDC